MARALREILGEQRGRWDLPRGLKLCRHLAPLVEAAKAFSDAKNALFLDVRCRHCGAGIAIIEAVGLSIISDGDGYQVRDATGKWGRKRG